MHVQPEHTISWSLQPHKKSLNFGIFKHPGNSGLVATAASSTHSGSDLHDSSNHSKAGDSSSVTEKLRGIGLKPISWIGKCEADKISQGTYDVPANDGGNYALVFDNTFSKTISKTVTFVLMTYPTNCPPRSGHQIHHSQAVTGSIGSSRSETKFRSASLDSRESLRQTHSRSGPGSNSHPPPGGSDPKNKTAPPVHTGILQKRRRKRHQGFARRFFMLDLDSSTLTYYHDRNSSALRGSIPLSLAAVASNEETREFSIDSGAEIWHLRALNNDEFALWKRALEKASRKKDNKQQDDLGPRSRTQTSQTQPRAAAQTREWDEVGKLVEKVSASKDKVRQLAQDTDPKYLVFADYDGAGPGATGRKGSKSTEARQGEEKRSFWNRKAKNDNNGVNMQAHRNLSQNTLAMPNEPSSEKNGPDVSASSVSGVHDNLMLLLQDLNSVLAEFNTLLLDRGRCKSAPAAPSIKTIASVESDLSQEFFDATDGGNTSPLLTMHHDSGDSDDEAKSPSTRTAVDEDVESLSGSEVDEEEDILAKKFAPDASPSLFPAKPKSLTPLPLESTPRRTKVAPPIGPPPSLISFLRKNVGKDLSTIAMPVTANEPVSLLQKAAEQLEYSELLDKAAGATDALERLIYVTAFAISPISGQRVRERSLRKPFNPMLGETYELVRPDKGFRFVAEKVSHRPVQLAYHADAKEWSFAQSPKPTQKFWGKSAEIITEGKSRLTLHTSGEHFSWSSGSSFLRNIIAGEKYVEPVGEMCIMNETTGQKVVVAFKAGGMFSGRSEELTAKAYGTHGEELPLGLQGTWTASLQLTENGNLTNKIIWAVGDLVDKPQKHYGFTTFAASLNETTAIETRKLPPTDTRLRPDQRALEDGDADNAEDLKAQLEERQRERRREMEANGEVWQPRWFAKAEAGGGVQGDSPWKLKAGKDGYWDERARGEWAGVVPVLSV